MTESRQNASKLLETLYSELRELASARLARQEPGQTLQPTSLVHEAYLKLVGDADPGWDGKAHFFGAAARAMRQVLVDHARHKARLKRGGGAGDRITLSGLSDSHQNEMNEDEFLRLDAALDALTDVEPRKAEVVLLRFFAGLNYEQIGAALGVTSRTAERDWSFSKAWLRRHMQEQVADNGA